MRALLGFVRQALDTPRLFHWRQVGPCQVLGQPHRGVRGIVGVYDQRGDARVSQEPDSLEPAEPGDELVVVVLSAQAYGVDETAARDGLGEYLKVVGVKGKAIVAVVVSADRL